jgi:hypothetical protein
MLKIAAALAVLPNRGALPFFNNTDPSTGLHFAFMISTIAVGDRLRPPNKTAGEDAFALLLMSSVSFSKSHRSEA